MYGAGDVRVENVPDQVISQPTDALVRVLRSCICGSDLHPFHNMEAGDPSPMGHELLGVVEDLGSEVYGFSKGDVVIVPFVWSDGTCDFCREGLQTSCRHGGFWGTGLRPGETGGGQAEALRVPQAQGTLVKVPVAETDELLPSLLTLSDVYPTGYHCAVTAGVTAGRTVTVIGDGAVGLSAVLSAKQLGAERIILMGRHKDRTDLALSSARPTSSPSAVMRASSGCASSPAVTAPTASWRRSATCPPSSRRSVSYGPAAQSAASVRRSTTASRWTSRASCRT
jgi:threonine dehydrogenase-like Zn-dependent dehydrogenase